MHSISALHQKISDLFDQERFLFEPVQLYEPIDYALAQGGKRLRPLLVLLSCDLYGGDLQSALKPAIGVELFHNFTLLHDDIMDNATLRRGKSTVHKRWNANVAILSGDTMFVMAYDYIAKVPQHCLAETIDLFNDTARKVCEGQQYDMNFETQKDVSVEDYLTMIRLKTAVLLACSVKLGAILANASSTETEILYTFGDNLGMAFQLQDDLLDVFGDVEKFGKEIGGDIITNKKTYLYLKAFELARGDELVRLTHYFNDPLMDPGEKIRRIKESYSKLGVDVMTRELIGVYYEKAIAALKQLKVPEERISELLKLTEQIINRES